MYLRRIELAGFKSFADKTELEFAKGIAAVVGPNGSGKSNISDSIRWVLGEQSARSLRGGNMQDVIFAGSNTRRAVNYSEVSLTLDNSDGQLPVDYSEVSVTRRLHRSGESEYFFNKQPCRLKDITEMFMDTGIGREAYSIIGQGRIEEILSTKSEDRRGIFEEAAGIVKYKTRKKEAERKLENTDQNLLRIYDLEAELEGQIEPLREQADKAIRYKQLRESLQASEVSLAVYQIEATHAAWQDACSHLAVLEKRQIELSTIVSKHDAELEQERLQARQLDETLESLQAQLLTYSEEAEKADGHAEVLRERMKNLLLQKEEADKAITAVETRIQRLNQERDDVQTRYAAVAAQLQELEFRQQAEESKLREISDANPGELEEGLKGELLEVLNALSAQKHALQYARQQLDEWQRRSDKRQVEEQEWEEKRKLLDRSLEQWRANLTEAAESIEDKKERYEQASFKRQDKVDQQDELALTTRKWQQRQDALIAKKETLKDLQEGYDGFFHGVREILKVAKKPQGLRGVHGAVAELIKVSEDMEAAIETALGSALQFIVMEDERSSRDAIAMLKSRQWGKATFLPMDVIRGRSIDSRDERIVSEMPGYCGVALDLIAYEERYHQVLSSLLGHVLVAETLEDANRIASACQYRLRIVTLEGDVVNAGGSMTGGSRQRKTASLLGRQRQIEELDKEIASSNLQLSQLAASSNRLREQIASLASEVEQWRTAGEQARLHEQQVQSELRQTEQQIRSLDAQLQLFREESGDLYEERQQLLSREEACLAQLEHLTQQEQDLQLMIAEAEQRRRERDFAKEEYRGLLTDLKVQAAQWVQERMDLKQRLERLDQERSGQRQEKEGWLERATTAATQIAHTTEESGSQHVRTQQLDEQKRATAHQIDLLRAERAQRYKRLELEEEVTREQRQELKQVEEKHHALEVKSTRLDVELDNLLKKLSEDHELSYELAKSRFEPPADPEETRLQIKSLRQSVQALGEVNLGAVEEFERVSERCAFLHEQREDLVEAKATLLKVIKEIEDEMSARFRQTFSEIREQFGHAFVKLFGGGRADLILNEPERLLETGIDIVAQPPGKKLQNLQLLSGGERALTAIALLFAILHVKPVPFCVLDEVEAALDEANVSRFASYLRAFSHQTQFIVVTHRKGTMEEADVLYGVTMEEDGVSKLVSVRLEEEAG